MIDKLNIDRKDDVEFLLNKIKLLEAKIDFYERYIIHQTKIHKYNHNHCFEKTVNELQVSVVSPEIIDG